ncbi:DUF6415 family natural product biosynthesis protein [Streptomyces sp. NBC_00445]|uniref:DUF6415 family natural product biosynthesis protein n=1 Tax=Streptomyces sp. NBC_00445 TaxID=2975745 RepID=UPI003FCDBC31
MTEVSQELLAFLPVTYTPAGATPAQLRSAQVGFDASRIREGIRTARSWRQARVDPHPSTLAAVIRALCGHVTSLLPYASMHQSQLGTGSESWWACRRAIELAQEARATPVTEGVPAAREHVFSLATYVDALLRYAEQGCERGAACPLPASSPKPLPLASCRPIATRPESTLGQRERRRCHSQKHRTPLIRTYKEFDHAGPGPDDHGPAHPEGAGGPSGHRPGGEHRGVHPDCQRARDGDRQESRRHGGRQFD